MGCTAWAQGSHRSKLQGCVACATDHLHNPIINELALQRIAVLAGKDCRGGEESHCSGQE